MDPSATWLRFMGHSRDVMTEMANAHVIVTPSTAPEALKLVALEAMAMSRPVVATRVGGVPEVVENGATGYLVEPGDDEALADAITALLRDPSTARAMGHAGQRRAEDVFSNRAFTEYWRRLYIDYSEANPLTNATQQ
jgi:glycosyltransferase involved in cell wall biosynthesis